MNEELVNRVAKALAAAYCRGILSQVSGIIKTEDTVKQYVEGHWYQWADQARIVVSDKK